MTLPTNNRRIRLALWAQKCRRNRQHRLLPAPVLRAAYPDLLRWDWDLPNPFKWNVWMSINGGEAFLVGDYWAYGNLRQFAPDGGSETYFIVGVDEAGNEITGRSNAVRPDEGNATPAPVLVGDAEAETMTWATTRPAGYDVMEIQGSEDGGVNWWSINCLATEGGSDFFAGTTYRARFCTDFTFATHTDWSNTVPELAAPAPVLVKPEPWVITWATTRPAGYDTIEIQSDEGGGGEIFAFCVSLPATAGTWGEGDSFNYRARFTNGTLFTAYSNIVSLP